jgi:hypothetical protein
LNRRDLLLGGAVLLLLAVAIVRTAVPDRSRIRPLSIYAIDFPSEPIKKGETIEREKTWSPPDDVYVMGWNPRVYAAASAGLLSLHSLPEKVRLFEYREGEGLAKTDFPPGTGFLLKKGQQLAATFRIGNSGPDSQTHGAVAYIYFVPVQGN